MVCKENIKCQLVLVLVVAAVVRLGFMIWGWSGYYIVSQNTLSIEYFKAGYCIAAGYGYVVGTGPAREHINELYKRVNSENFRVKPENAGPMPQQGMSFETLHPPGMALLIAGINRVLGVRADVPIQIIGTILDTIAAGLLCWLVSSFFGVRVGLITGLAYALFPPLAYCSSIAMVPGGLLTVFVISCLACILQGIHSKGWRAVLWYAVAGLVLGLGGYLRPDYILMPVVMGLGVWLCTRRFWYSVRAMVLVQIVVILVLLPWAYRNHSVYNRWIFMSTSVGGTLITGLGEFNNPWGFGYTDFDRYEEAKAQGFDTPWVSEADVYFRKLFMDSVKQKPAAYLMTIVRRLPLALVPPLGWGYANPYKTQTFTEHAKAGADRYQVARDKLGYVLAAYWDRLVMAGICVVGLICSFVMLFLERRRFGLILLFLLPYVYAVLSHLPTHMEPRLLLPGIFGLLIAIGYVAGKGWRYRFN